MKERLNRLLENSYSPYSHFRVAAIVVMKDGQSFEGVNVENATYGATICAERSAILGAVSHGYKRLDFDTLYVMCDNEKIGMPCFVCRAVISEFMEKDCKVVCMNPMGEEEVHTVSELCPYPFSSEDLEHA